MMVAVVVVPVMRNSDRALNTADCRPHWNAHDSPDWTCNAIAFMGAFLRAPDDSLGLCCQGHGKNSKRQ